MARPSPDVHIGLECPPATPSRIRDNMAERDDREPFGPCSLSLLSARRPSWAPTPFDNPQDRNTTSLASYREVPKLATHSQLGESSSPEVDGNTFRGNLQIDMKDLVGDAVGNMSISPAGRDVVLAARRGLFIIDLEAPLEVPRFLPQGGIWDVADVQWNPHHHRAEYIVSTSSEKLLIWNLKMPGKTTIEHVLHSHYRAITDINWHTFEWDLVSSVGIDSWLWTWDLRKPRKPVLGLCAFNGGGTQVKWNRRDPNVLASSHMNEVLIWDRRKGSLPTARIRAHSAKIYGIDWAHARVSDIVTCSLDKSIKIWNVQEVTSTETSEQHPVTTFNTRYPVWRARDLPFGRGVLSLPQRGETVLEMWAEENSLMPVEVLEGHTDVVKEFVWRTRGARGEYQLITWSKDRTLRFWPVDSEAMERVGHKPGHRVGETQSPFPSALDNHHQSFRNPPESIENLPALSAPIGSRSILAEVRARLPPRKPANPVLQPHHGSAARGKGTLLLETIPHSGSQNSQRSYSQNQHLAPTPGATMTMTRGNVAGMRSARMDAFAWLASVRVGHRRDGSSSSHVSSRSRVSSQKEHTALSSSQKRKRSISRPKERRESDEAPQSLQDEITSVLTKLSLHKIRLEKHELTKKRTCTLGLHGPWGESSSVFIRVSFRFPKGYPSATHPGGMVEIELERNPLISMQNRAFMLRKLRTIRERQRPCLESCLRFLLFGDDSDQADAPVDMGSESSSEDDGAPQLHKPRDPTVSLLRNNKNLAEPRSSQGVFGPNGELVCFFGARLVCNPLSEMASPVTNSRSPQPSRDVCQPPSLLSDAVRRLGIAAVDHRPDTLDYRLSDESNHTMRVMTNLLTFSQPKHRHPSDPQAASDDFPNTANGFSTRCSTVYIQLPSDISFSQRLVAAEYIFEAPSITSLCATNANVARMHGQLAHERVFRTLQSLFPTSRLTPPYAKPASASLRVMEKIYREFCTTRDVQMLAMIAVVLTKAHNETSVLNTQTVTVREPTSVVSKAEYDYFNLPSPDDTRSAVLSPGWPRLPSTTSAAPILAPASSLSASNSSRGAWSSLLFNTGSVRQFMSGVQESISTPLDTFSFVSSVPIPNSNGVVRIPNLDAPRRKALGKDPPSPASPISKSWSETHVILPMRPSLSSTSSQSHRPTNSRSRQQRRLVIIDEEFERKESNNIALPSCYFAQFVCHILFYAETLFRWQLIHKRLELLNVIKSSPFMQALPHCSQELGFDVQPACRICGFGPAIATESCSTCGNRPGRPLCSICRLPVKGLSVSCGQCLHVSHVKCLRHTQSDVCGSGCGCTCGHPKFKNQDLVGSSFIS